MAHRLTTAQVLYNYSVGAFPMGNDDGQIHWYSPDPRCVFPLDAFHVPRTVRQLVRRGVFEIRINTHFDEIITACATRPEGTWISDAILHTYRSLHRQGWAHSVECWQTDRLAGGLYGVAIGGAFFGESMCTGISGASKVALVALIERLRQRGFTLLDTQWSTPHLERFGAIEIPRRQYLRHLRAALLQDCRFADPP